MWGGRSASVILEVHNVLVQVSAVDSVQVAQGHGGEGQLVRDALCDQGDDLKS